MVFARAGIFQVHLSFFSWTYSPSSQLRRRLPTAVLLFTVILCKVCERWQHHQDEDTRGASVRGVLGSAAVPSPTSEKAADNSTTWWPRGLGRYESRQHQASSGSFRLSRWSVHLFPQHPDEKVAKLHFPALNVELTTLAQTQADSTSVKVVGPFKSGHYRFRAARLGRRYCRSQRVQVEFLYVLLRLCCPWRLQPEVPCFWHVRDSIIRIFASVRVRLATAVRHHRDGLRCLAHRSGHHSFLMWCVCPASGRLSIWVAPGHHSLFMSCSGANHPDSTENGGWARL